MRFAGKIAVVTGAASGIGKAAVLKLAGEGAHVFAADIDEAGGRALAEQSNGKIDFVRCDVTVPADIEALMNTAAEKAGGIDIVFNNAAAGGDRAPIDEITPEGWDRTMDLVLKSVAMGIRYAAPHMKHRKGASIVNTASVAALGAGYSPTAYAVAKAGLESYVRVLAKEQRERRVTLVRMGAVDTPLWGRLPFRLPRGAQAPEAIADAIVRAHAAGERGDLDL